MIGFVLACSPAAWPGTLRRLQLSQSWLPCRRRRYAKICRMCPVVLRLADHRHRSRMVFLDAVDKADLPARPSSAILQPPQEHSPLQGNIRPLGAFVGAREAARQCPSLTAAPASARAVSFCSFFCAATPYNKAPFLNAPIRSQYHFPPDCFPTPPRRRGAPGGKTSSKKALRLFVLTVMITLQRFSSRLWRGVSL